MADTTLILKTIVEGTAESRKNLKQVTTGVEELGKSSKSVDTLSTALEKNAAGFVALGVAAAASFYAIVRGSSQAIDAATSQQNALVGLRSIVRGTGNDFAMAEEFMKKFTADGLVPVGDAATSLKNLLARGFGLEEATVIMDRFKDSAAFGRQSSLQLGEAIRGATEGLKNENSVLVDNAGVTKNVSAMWKDYAEKLGVGVQSLTLAQKREAELNGILEETRFQIGDAAKLTDSYAGATARNAAAQTQLSVALGTALQPATQAFYEAVTPLLVKLTDWINTNPKITASITMVLGAVTGMIAGVVALGFAIAPMKAAWAALISAWTYISTVAVPSIIAALGAISAPVWIVVGAIAALVAAGVALWKNWDTVVSYAKAFWEKLTELFTFGAQLVTGIVIGAFNMMGIDIVKLWNDLTVGFNVMWAAIKVIAQMGMEWMSSVFTKYLSPVKAAWDVLWGSLGGSVTNAWNNVQAIIKGNLNGIIDMINRVISALNKLAATGAAAIGSKPVSIPTIPRLADGGIVKARPGGILANIGEGGEDEAVIPLSKMKNMGGGGGVNIYFTGTFGKDAAESIGDMIMEKLARSVAI